MFFNYQIFIYQYTFFFLYIYSFILIGITSAVYIGWWILLITHFLQTAYLLSNIFFRGKEPTFYVLFISCFFTLYALTTVVLQLSQYIKQDPSVNGISKTILMIPADKQPVLNSLFQFFVSVLCLTLFVFYIFQLPVYKNYLFPFYINRYSDYTITTIQMIKMKDYTLFFGEYLIPWICGSSQLAILGLSSYLIFLSLQF